VLLDYVSVSSSSSHTPCGIFTFFLNERETAIGEALSYFPHSQIQSTFALSFGLSVPKKEIEKRNGQAFLVFMEF